MRRTKKWIEAVSKPRPQHVKDAISKAQKKRKHQPQEGFQKGHKAIDGTEKTRFKKGQVSWNKGKKCPWAETHGMADTKFYRRWLSLNQRCNNPNFKQYDDYGGRGIKVEWKNFEEFRRDMFESYIAHRKKYGELQTRIERTDNNGNYSKRNCVWATCGEQMRNRRNNHLITHEGKTQCITDWAREIGIGYPALWKRLKKMSIKEALNYEV